MAKFQALRQHLRTNLWIVPLASVGLAIGLSQGLTLVDEAIPQDRRAWYLFIGQAGSAREFLSVIASSLLALTGLVFTITVLVLQLASSQYSSRVLRTFLQDRTTRLTMAVFIGSFVYALLLIPEVRSSSDALTAFVPALSVFMALVLALLSVGVFVHYIHHMAHFIRAGAVIRRVGEETRSSMERIYPEGAGREPTAPVSAPPGEPDQSFPHDRSAGVVTAVNESALLAVAAKRGLVIELVPRVGDFLPRGAPLFKVWGRATVQLTELRELIHISDERTHDQDPAFGFRQLVDIAERALSPGVTDPTTAVQALDQLHDLLRSLAARPLPSAVRLDEAGHVRLVLPRPDWEAYVHLALDEIREYGRGSLQIARRLAALLQDLLTVALEERKPVLMEQLMLLEKSQPRGQKAGPDAL